MYANKLRFLFALLLVNAFASESGDSAESICVDRVGKFRMIKNRNFKRNCSWLTKNSWRAAKRKENYCSKAQVKTLCQLTCDFCECEDDPNFTFPLYKEHLHGDCAWLTQNQWYSETRINNYCKWIEV